MGGGPPSQWTARGRRQRGSRIPVGDDRFAEHQSHWKVHLESHSSPTAPLLLITGRKQDTQTGGSDRPRLGITRQLIPVIQGHVTQPGAESLDVLNRDGVAELVANAAERPLLGKAVAQSPPSRSG